MTTILESSPIILNRTSADHKCNTLWNSGTRLGKISKIKELTLAWGLVLVLDFTASNGARPLSPGDFYE